MDRQRSFSVKSTKFLAFTFTISSCVLFVTFFSIWVFNFTPLIHQETHLHLNKTTSFVLNLNPITVQTFFGFTGNNNNLSAISGSDKGSILTNTQFDRSENFSVSVEISGFNDSQRKKNETQALLEEREERGTVNGFGNFSSHSEKDSILVDAREQKHENISGFVSFSAFNGSETEKYAEKIVVPESKKEENENTTSSVPAQGGGSGSGTLSRVETEAKGLGECDLTKGKWIYDESYPLYTNWSCPFIDEGFNCQGNGRVDKDYLKWRWQPQDCHIPRFNATNMLKLIRGKRLVFVGDSLNRNQWESMLCMLMGAVKDPKRVYETHGRRITKAKGDYSFKFVDYQCTVEYYVTHFLVHESKARIGQKRVPTLRIDAIERGSSRWRGADILIFNTAHWWSHYKTKAGINYYQEGNKVHPQLDVSIAFRKALTTWASWVDKHINPTKTRVFFRSSSPSHFSGGQWNSGGHCKEATRPLDTIPAGYPEKNMIVEDVLTLMKTPVTFLNITKLSNYRVDGHPSSYGGKSAKGRKSVAQDCSHWCLPGVPDTWNELLFMHLQTMQHNAR